MYHTFTHCFKIFAGNNGTHRVTVLLRETIHAQALRVHPYIGRRNIWGTTAFVLIQYDVLICNQGEFHVFYLNKAMLVVVVVVLVLVLVLVVVVVLVVLVVLVVVQQLFLLLLLPRVRVRKYDTYFLFCTDRFLADMRTRNDR